MGSPPPPFPSPFFLQPSPALTCLPPLAHLGQHRRVLRNERRHPAHHILQRQDRPKGEAIGEEHPADFGGAGEGVPPQGVSDEGLLFVVCWVVVLECCVCMLGGRGVGGELGVEEGGGV